MDTVKVDIKKLQLLNDRINQCIDALGQVRLSVHGLSHTTGLGQGVPPAGLGFAPFSPLPPTASFIPGIAHTNPMGVTPFGGSPFGGAPFAQAPLGASPFAGSESPEAFSRPLWADPYWASRVAQTFPYAQAIVPPQIPGY